MKNIIFILLLLLGSCKKNNENIQVSKFVEDLILCYTEEYNKEKYNYDIVTVSLKEDSQHYIITIIGEMKALLYKDELYMGSQKYNGYEVLFWGDTCSQLLSVKDYPRKSEFKSSLPEFEYDPIVWEIWLYKNFTLDEMRTYMVNPEEDIEVIKNIFHKYYKKDSVYLINNEVFISVQEKPTFKMGIDSLMDFIYKNFTLPENYPIDENVLIVVGGTVTKTGGLINPEILKSSHDSLLDQEAIRVISLVPDSFIPAKHRGEIVNAKFSFPIWVNR